MSKNKLSDLRDHMFDVIERLKSNNDQSVDDNEKIDIETAKAIAQAGGVILHAAKLELDYVKQADKMGYTVEKTTFFSEPKQLEK